MLSSEEVKLANEDYKEFMKRKSTDIKCAKLITDFLESSNNFTIIRKSADVKKVFDESPASGNYVPFAFRESFHEVLSFIPKEHTSFQSDVIGEITKGTSALDRYMTLKPLIEADIPRLRQMQPVSADKCESWKGHGFRLSGNSRQLLFMAGDKCAPKTLKVYNLDGIEKGCVQFDHNIIRVLCIDDGDNNMIAVKTNGDSIELRDAMDPTLLLGTIRSFHGAALCQTSPNTIMLARYVNEPSTIREYEVGGGEIAELKREISIPLKYVYGMVSVSDEHQKLLVMTSWQEKNHSCFRLQHTGRGMEAEG